MCLTMPGPCMKSLGLTGLLVAPSLLLWAFLQRRKRDCSSDSGEQLQEDMGGLLSRAPRSSPFFLPQLPVPEEQKDASSSESEEEDHQGDSASALSGNPSLSPWSSGHSWNQECSSEAKEEQRGGPWCSDIALQECISLLSLKRWREYLSLMEKEQRQPLRCLRPAPLTHLSVIENPCGLKRKHRSLVLPEHHAAFTRLLEDPVIKRFLAWDKQMGASDKYLLATVIAYFSRAGLFPWEYQRIHFFLALYLANDMEEDDHILKQGIFLFLYNWNLKQISEFHKLRYQFICCMDWNLRVTREECEEIQAYDPALWVWSRDRALIPGPWYPENSALKKISGPGSNEIHSAQHTTQSWEPMVGP